MSSAWKALLQQVSFQLNQQGMRAGLTEISVRAEARLQFVETISVGMSCKSYAKKLLSSSLDAIVQEQMMQMGRRDYRTWKGKVNVLPQQAASILLTNRLPTVTACYGPTWKGVAQPGNTHGSLE